MRLNRNSNIQKSYLTRDAMYLSTRKPYVPNQLNNDQFSFITNHTQFYQTEAQFSEQELETKVIENTSAVTANQNNIVSIQNDQQLQDGKIDANEIAISALQSGQLLQDTDRGLIDAQVQQLQNVQQDHGDSIALNTTAINNIPNYQTQIDSINLTIGNMQTDIQDNTDAITAAINSLQTQIDQQQLVIDSNTTTLNGHTTDITTLQNAEDAAADLVTEWNNEDYSRFMSVLKANSLAYKEQLFEIFQPTINTVYSFNQGTSTKLADLHFDVRIRFRTAVDGYGVGDTLLTYFENAVHGSAVGYGRGIAIHGHPASEQTFTVSTPDSRAITAIRADGGTCETVLSNVDILIKIRSFLDWTPPPVV